jgi:hypothetical protein
MGFHAVTLWQNETSHFLYHMNIIIQTHFNSQTGKKEANNTSESIEEAYYLVERMLFVSVFPLCRATLTNTDVRTFVSHWVLS